ncbi:MAG: ABC-type transport system substrate-binding protein [Planctomycetota bacterium]|jgi:ABC-type transport system substrate-binding protein
MRLLFRDHAGARNALLLGETDWYSGPDCNALLAQHPELTTRYVKRVYDHPQLGVYRIIWDCRHKPFDDARVRRALGMLVAREQALAVLSGDGRTAAAHAKPSSLAYPDEPPLPFDPAAARRLLREAGYDADAGNALRVTLLALAGSEPPRRITELFQDAARQAGVQVEVRTRELTPFLAERKRNEWHGSLVLQWFDASGAPYRFLHSHGRSNPGAWNQPKADALAVAARLEQDPAKRAAVWKQLHALAHHEQPAALIIHPLAAVLLSKKLRDFDPGACGLRPDWAWAAGDQRR